jgi:DNA-binding transcriptional LysR family regulator
MPPGPGISTSPPDADGSPGLDLRLLKAYGGGMRDHLKRVFSEVDSAFALVIALTMSVLGLFSITSNALANCPGTYTRAVTLPACYRFAREHRRSVEVRLEILDPTDLEVCERSFDGQLTPRMSLRGTMA